MNTITPRRAYLPFAAALLAACTLAPLAAAQEARPAGWTMVVSGSHRWMHGRQQAAFARGGGEQTQIAIDSVRRDGARGERTLLIHMDTAASVTHDARGRLVRIDAPVEYRGSPGESALDSVTAIGWSVMEGGQLILPAARLWDLVPSLPAGAPRAGLRWTDPVDLHAVAGPYAQSLRGERVSIIVRDTMVQGRRMWIVRDSAAVRYEERWIRMERTLADSVGVERVADGIVRGRHLYDPALGLFRQRADTARYAGEATLRYPDGRRFRTPARYERTRAWMLYDSASLARREQEAMDAARRHNSGGMLRFADGEIEERLSKGDTVLRDSLIAAWNSARDPGARSAALLALGWHVGEEKQEEMAQLALLAGDTAYYVRHVVEGFYTGNRPPVNAAELQILLPFMNDPGLAFAFGIDLDPMYEDPRQGLLTDPPAVQPDSTRWSCTRAACELLMAQYDQAREPRLRALGLIARLAFDPARWGPVVLREGPANPYLAYAVMAVRGVAATWEAAAHAPIPEPGADWRAWLEWMDGRNPAYAAANPTLPRPGVRWDAAHRTTVRFQQVLTGRRIVDELHARLAAAESDSARLVFGTMLVGMDEAIHTPAQIAQMVQSASVADRALGMRQLPMLFRDAVPADSATAEVLVDRVLAIQIDAAQPWPDVDGKTARAWVTARGEGPIPALLRRDSLPPEVARRWGARVRLLSAAELAALPQREPGTRIRVSRPMVLGPFARVDLRFDSRYPRGADEAPAGNAGLWSAWLLKTPGGWVLVMQGGSIT
ncbi:hypothetical protein [Longimicrobium terrae]|uniref:Uncharacterized protein n=1 Tax=Longimicrobium terrae TaxID=1639882 RepID=A0A841GWC3_9BACT|nr:hypothetical protein [Longimicrobium terrae]MBB4635001.1 hypothetical protein [Longimicrobium terrae]MBB6069395.1 hypothetical protein [Longimicrobium terrae]NNC31798.1 hypothetical protein [Longimicrobium terrae]